MPNQNPNVGRRQFFSRMFKEAASVVREIKKFEQELTGEQITPLVSRTEYEAALAKVQDLETLADELRQMVEAEQEILEEKVHALFEQMIQVSRHIYERLESLQNSLVQVDLDQVPHWTALQERILQLANLLKPIQMTVTNVTQRVTGNPVASATIGALFGAWVQEELYPELKELPQDLYDRWQTLFTSDSTDEATPFDQPLSPTPKPQASFSQSSDFPEMITIPAGYFWMGSDPAQDSLACKEEQPQHRVYLSEYAIGKYPITNAQYLHFIHETAYRPPRHWDNGNVPPGKEHHPVVYVSWDDANAYCRWLSRKMGQLYGLPTEAQWEKAARGTDGRIYPWGNQAPNAELCNFNSNVGDTTAVGSYPQGISAYGCLDMAGNVDEWTSGLFDADFYKNSPEQDPTGPKSGMYRVLRGGAWFGNPYSVRAACRSLNYHELFLHDFGIRLCGCLS